MASAQHEATIAGEKAVPHLGHELGSAEMERKNALARFRGRGYVPTMPKRMLLQFGQRGFPSYDCVDEQGMPQPCALGVPWVHEDTLRTLARLSIPRTDPWGRPLPEGASEAQVRVAR
jgi:hypothetical protein